MEKLINNRIGRKPVLLYNLEELVSYCLMKERKFFGLTTKSIKRIAFVFAIKMGLPFHCQYNKEEQAGSGCGIANLDCGCATPKLLRKQE
jgi:hypothetical protein